jgi:hypothetical protein
MSLPTAGENTAVDSGVARFGHYGVFSGQALGDANLSDFEERDPVERLI